MAARSNSQLILELNTLQARLAAGADLATDPPEGVLPAELLQESAGQLNRLEAALQRVERQVKLINYLEELLQTCHTPEETYPKIAEVAGTLFEGQIGSLSILHPPGIYLETLAGWGAHALSQPIFALEDCWAMQRGQPYEVVDPQTAVICRHLTHAPDTGYLCLPLIVQGQPLGLLSLSFPSTAEPADHHPWQALALSLANMTKLALSNLDLREALYEQSIHDALTGLFNRKYVEETLPRELHRVARKHLPLCVASVDVDHFRRFNNIFGHAAGDRVLQEVSQLLSENLRKSDIVARYGPDQFLVILPDAVAADARERLEQINLRAKDLKFQVGEQAVGGVSLSAGIAQSAEGLLSGEKLIQLADRALQTAKQAGRDTIAIYRDDE